MKSNKGKNSWRMNSGKGSVLSNKNGRNGVSDKKPARLNIRR